MITIAVLNLQSEKMGKMGKWGQPPFLKLYKTPPRTLLGTPYALPAKLLHNLLLVLAIKGFLESPLLTY